jgi:small nuclear ribonucleoprotein (snRNP)-like protein
LFNFTLLIMGSRDQIDDWPSLPFEVDTLSLFFHPPVHLLEQLSTMAELLNTPNSELDEQQIRLKEEFQISQGPLSVLQSSVRNHTQILISLRNNKKLLARVKAFDRHSNMVLENVKEVRVKKMSKLTVS